VVGTKQRERERERDGGRGAGCGTCIRLLTPGVGGVQGKREMEEEGRATGPVSD
jgi:hypothetical protein